MFPVNILKWVILKNGGQQSQIEQTIVQDSSCQYNHHAKSICRSSCSTNRYWEPIRFLHSMTPCLANIYRSQLSYEKQVISSKQIDAHLIQGKMTKNDGKPLATNEDDHPNIAHTNLCHPHGSTETNHSILEGYHLEIHPNVLNQRIKTWDAEKERQELERRLQRSSIPLQTMKIILPNCAAISASITSETALSQIYQLYEKGKGDCEENPLVGASYQDSLGNRGVMELGMRLIDWMMTLSAHVTAPDGESNSSTTLEHYWFQIDKWIYFGDDQGREIFWHSSAHVLAAAIELFYLDQWVEEGLTFFKPPNHYGFEESSINDTVDRSQLEKRIVPLLNHSGCRSQDDSWGGFFYDFSIHPHHLTEVNYKKIQSIAMWLIRQKLPFERLQVSKSVACAMFNYNPLKMAILHKIPDTEKITLYRLGGHAFIDPCRGPHLPHIGLIQTLEIIQGSGTYLHGHEGGPSLQRLHGISFPTAKQWKKWKIVYEEASSRDHRAIGKKQLLFLFHPSSPGSPFYLPHGTIIFNRLVAAVRQEYLKREYSEVITPLIYDKRLWIMSGHWAHYQENMFLIQPDKPPMNASTESSMLPSQHDHAQSCETSSHWESCGDRSHQMGLKPMNCPGHCLMFKSQNRSYRDLPIRYADFSSLHRNEVKGSLSGLTRVRRFHQDDAHIFCTEDQIEQEINDLIDMINHFYVNIFGFTYEMLVSTRPDSRMGSDQEWDHAEIALIKAIEKSGHSYKININDGAFYGPKIDFLVTDAIKRKHQCATIQLDFQLPNRFDLNYMSAEGKLKTPVMIHRAVVGSLERMMAILLEHYAGRLPFWLSPRQVAICSISERHVTYARKIGKDIQDRGFSVEYYHQDVKLGNKIRLAQHAQCNYIVVLGDEEEQEQMVNVRERSGQRCGKMSLEMLLERFKKDVNDWK